MRKTVVFSCAALLALASPCPGAPPPGYSLQWADEFDGDSLNTNFWNIEAGTRNQAVNTADAVSVTNGCLVLTTYTANGKNYTGFIDTKHKVLHRYGYYEARIQFANAPGNWSAFWLQSPRINQTNSLNDPANGVEIDIFEHRLIDGSRVDWINGGDHALHWNGYVKGIHRKNDHFDRNLGINSGFHTYGLLWTANQYTFYVDGRPTWTSHYLVSTADEYVLLTSEVKDKTWAGDIPASGYPDLAHSQVRMLVDYVRYYAPPAADAAH